MCLHRQLNVKQFVKFYGFVLESIFWTREWVLYFEIVHTFANGGLLKQSVWNVAGSVILQATEPISKENPATRHHSGCSILLLSFCKDLFKDVLPLCFRGYVIFLENWCFFALTARIGQFRTVQVVNCFSPWQKWPRTKLCRKTRSKWSENIFLPFCSTHFLVIVILPLFFDGSFCSQFKQSRR